MCILTFFCSIAQSCPTLCDPVDCSTPGSCVLHYLLEFAQTSCPLSWWCHPTILSSVTPFSCVQSFLASGSFFTESVLCTRWPKYWSFSISPSNEYLGLISFWIDWFDLSCPRDSEESSPAPQFESVSSLVLSLLYDPTLTSVHDYWKIHSFDYMDLCWQSDVSAF